MKVKKAIIAAAGFGTRMLPATKAVPKEMLPIIDKPVIQYIIEEVVEAGITDIIIVTGYYKRTIEDHFDHIYELEEWLKKCGKKEELKEIRRVSDMANFTFVRQKEGYGNAMPIISTKHLLNDSPFLFLWGDIIADKRRSFALLEAYEEVGASVLAATKKDTEHDFKSYGYIIGENGNESAFQIEGMIEKPGTSEGHSGLSVMNGYVLTPEILPLVDKLETDERGEIGLIEAIDKLARKSKVYAKDISDIKQYDTGNKQDYIKTILHKSLEDASLKPIVEKIVGDIGKTLSS